MPRIIRKSTLLAFASLTAMWLLTVIASHADAQHRGNDCPNCRQAQAGRPDLFYNYYVPSTCGGVPNSMYLAPTAVPAHVGHTYITYQPMMPHEMLYNHHRTYYRYYNGGRGMTRTHVKWYSPPGAQLSSRLRIAR